jgi:glyoxylase-like metal-dependent hydrolase (beta-lactamase superfamily II)
MFDQQLYRLTEHILYLPPDADTDRPLLAAISGEKYTLLVDAGNSSAHAELFLKELNKYPIAKPSQVVLTHGHWEHVFGAHYLNLPCIASEGTKQEIEKMLRFSWTDEALKQRVRAGIESSFSAEMIKKEWGDNRQIPIILPSQTFSERMELDLGGIHCLIEHVGGDHADDSSVVYVKEDKVLFLGDCLYPDYKGDRWRYTVKGTQALLNRLEKYDADLYVLSHDIPLSKTQFRIYADLLKLFCQITIKMQGEIEAMISALSKELGRRLEPLERLVIRYFANGVEAVSAQA